MNPENKITEFDYCNFYSISNENNNKIKQSNGTTMKMGFCFLYYIQYACIVVVVNYQVIIHDTFLFLCFTCCTRKISLIWRHQYHQWQAAESRLSFHFISFQSLRTDFVGFNNADTVWNTNQSINQSINKSINQLVDPAIHIYTCKLNQLPQQKWSLLPLTMLSRLS